IRGGQERGHVQLRGERAFVGASGRSGGEFESIDRQEPAPDVDEAALHSHHAVQSLHEVGDLGEAACEAQRVRHDRETGGPDGRADGQRRDGRLAGRRRRGRRRRRSRRGTRGGRRVRRARRGRRRGRCRRARARVREIEGVELDTRLVREVLQLDQEARLVAVRRYRLAQDHKAPVVDAERVLGALCRRSLLLGLRERRLQVIDLALEIRRFLSLRTQDEEVEGDHEAHGDQADEDHPLVALHGVLPVPGTNVLVLLAAFEALSVCCAAESACWLSCWTPSETCGEVEAEVAESGDELGVVDWAAAPAPSNATTISKLITRLVLVHEPPPVPVEPPLVLEPVDEPLGSCASELMTVARVTPSMSRSEARKVATASWLEAQPCMSRDGPWIPAAADEDELEELEEESPEALPVRLVSQTSD